MAGHGNAFYTDPEVMQAKMDEYFALCDEGEEVEVYDKKKQETRKIRRRIPYTVPGLVHYLGFANRDGLQEYKTKPAFAFIVARAWTKIAQQRNERALTGDQDARFAQFDLGHNFGWAAKQEVDHKLIDGAALVQILAILPPDYAEAVKKLLTQQGQNAITS